MAVESATRGARAHAGAALDRRARGVPGFAAGNAICGSSRGVRGVTFPQAVGRSCGAAAAAPVVPAAPPVAVSGFDPASAPDPKAPSGGLRQSAAADARDQLLRHAAPPGRLHSGASGDAALQGSDHRCAGQTLGVYGQQRRRGRGQVRPY